MKKPVDTYVYVIIIIVFLCVIYKSIYKEAYSVSSVPTVTCVPSPLPANVTLPTTTPNPSMVDSKTIGDYNDALNAYQKVFPTLSDFSKKTPCSSSSLSLCVGGTIDENNNCICPADAPIPYLHTDGKIYCVTDDLSLTSDGVAISDTLKAANKPNALTFVCKAGYGNPGCAACSSTQYSVKGGKCLDPPANAKVNSTFSDFICNDGYERNGTTCSACGPGKFSAGGVACASCTAGSYSSNPVNTKCINIPSNTGTAASDGKSYTCNSGYYKDASGTCSQCSAGTYSAQNNNSTSCTPLLPHAHVDTTAPSGYRCDTGWATNGTTDCAICAPGYYGNGTTCTILPANATANSSGGYDCNNGYYKNTSNGQCVQVPANATINASKTGYNANAGYYKDTDGSIKDCPAGYYCAASAPKLACASGEYCPAKSSDHKSCAAGNSCPNPSTQTACAPGTYQPNGGQTSCAVCPAGQYCDGQGMTSGKGCPAGNYCPEGSSSYKQCPAGYYCPAGSSSYTQCPAGYYCPAGSSTYTDKPCPAGYACPAGLVAYNDSHKCPAGKYSTDGKTCNDCTNNTTSDPGSSNCPKCAYNYYKKSDGTCSTCDGQYHDETKQGWECAAHNYQYGSCGDQNCDYGFVYNIQNAGAESCPNKGFKNCVPPPPAKGGCTIL